MNDIFVVGIDMLKFGRFPDRTIDDMGAEVSLNALAEAGITMADVQAIYCGNIGEGAYMVGQRIAQVIGQTGIAITNVQNACATGATAFREAWIAIKAGLCDTVLAVGVEQMGKGMLGRVAAPCGVPIEGVMGSGSMPAVFATVGMEHVRKYGTTFEQFAKVSVKNHHHSTLNAKAMYQVETPLEQVMQAEMIAYPNTKLMCSVNVDGAAAAVLMSEAKVKAHGLMDRAVRIKASSLTSDPWSERDLVMQDFNTVTQMAADQAYAQAGVAPEDINLVELHDCFATAELVHYENLRLCAPGEAGRMIDTGEVALGGRVPVNVSGGLLSKGHPLGATGIANVYEICTHLRGKAGARQVPGARLGLTHVVGMGSACAVHILERV